jgi:hypothetical protein
MEETLFHEAFSGSVQFLKSAKNTIFPHTPVSCSSADIIFLFLAVIPRMKINNNNNNNNNNNLFYPPKV